jgi:hypothetical protein
LIAQLARCLDAVGGLVHVLVLPDSHDGPAGIVERGIVRTVALDVARELVARQ